VRYLVLETLCQYGHERLEEAGEADRLADAHLGYFLTMAEQAREHRFEAAPAGLAALELAPARDVLGGPSAAALKAAGRAMGWEAAVAAASASATT